MFLAKEKALYKTLNMMKAQNQTMTGFFWAPLERENMIIDRIHQVNALTKIQRFSNHSITPPTYFKTTEFTWAF